MLKIRCKQIEVFKIEATNHFEDDMVAHIRQFFPNHFGMAGQSVVRDVVRYGIQRSNTYGFVTQRNMCLYITVMAMLGSNFDKDFFFPWVPSILNDGNSPASTRAERLADVALCYMKEIGGKENIDINRAFVRLRKTYSLLATREPPRDFESYMKKILQSLYPKKYAVLGESVIERLIWHGIQTAAAYNITEKKGRLLLIVLMFFIGSLCDSEPFCPWLCKTLNDPLAKNEKAKINRLYRESTFYLEQWLTQPWRKDVDNVRL